MGEFKLSNLPSRKPPDPFYPLRSLAVAIKERLLLGIAEATWTAEMGRVSAWQLPVRFCPFERYFGDGSFWDVAKGFVERPNWDAKLLSVQPIKGCLWYRCKSALVSQQQNLCFA